MEYLNLHSPIFFRHGWRKYLLATIALSLVMFSASSKAAAGSVAEGSKTGGPATASAEEVAAELANPNTAMASMNFKNQFKTYSGDLPNALESRRAILGLTPL